MTTSKHRQPPLPATASEVPGAEHPEGQLRDAASIPAIVARAFSVAGLTVRARVLSRLLASVGPLALAVLGGGAFVKYLQQARWSEIHVSVEDAARATYGQVFELARYVQQSSPEVAEQVLAVLSRDVSTMAALGVSAAAMAIAHLARRNAPPDPRS